MSTWNPDCDFELTDSEDEIAMKRDFHGREAMLFVVDANLQVKQILFSNVMLLEFILILADRQVDGGT